MSNNYKFIFNIQKFDSTVENCLWNYIYEEELKHPKRLYWVLLLLWVFGVPFLTFFSNFQSLQFWVK